MDSAKIDQFISDTWDREIVPQLVDYIRIPNKSPMFDTDWVAHSYMEQAVVLMETWRARRPSTACRSRWCAWKAARR